MQLIVELNPVTAIREAVAKWKAKRKKLAFENRRDTLLTRANMNIFSWNTGVVRPTSTKVVGGEEELGFRIWITSSMERDWGDCVGIGIHDATHDSKGCWRFSHFSPARARLIAERLVMMAEQIEEREDAMNIDRDPVAKPEPANVQ